MRRRGWSLSVPFRQTNTLKIALALSQRAGEGSRSVIEVWKLLLKVFDLGKVEPRDVRIVGMLHGVGLMIFFRAIECLERNDLGHDWAGEKLREWESTNTVVETRCPGVTYRFSGRSLLDKFAQVFRAYKTERQHFRRTNARTP